MRAAGEEGLGLPGCVHGTWRLAGAQETGRTPRRKAEGEQGARARGRVEDGHLPRAPRNRLQPSSQEPGGVGPLTSVT